MARKKISVHLVGIQKLLNNLKRIPQIAEQQSKQIPALCSLEYVQLVKQKILSQDFTYDSLSPIYHLWKKQHFPQAKTFWHLNGDLHKAIQAIQINPKTFAGTVPASIIDFGGKSYGRVSSTSILKYAMALENGASWMQNGRAYNIPARPLFWPTGLEYEEHGYQKHIDKAVTALKQGWHK